MTSSLNSSMFKMRSSETSRSYMVRPGYIKSYGELVEFPLPT